MNNNDDIKAESIDNKKEKISIKEKIKKWKIWKRLKNYVIKKAIRIFSPQVKLLKFIYNHYYGVLSMIILLILILIPFIIIIIFEPHLKWDLSRDGLENFLTIFNPSIKISSGIVIIYGIWLTLMRMEKTDSQLKYLYIQGFENNFFKLLELHNNIKDKIYIKDHNNYEKKGTERFEELYKQFKILYENKGLKITSIGDHPRSLKLVGKNKTYYDEIKGKLEITRINETYKEFFTSKQGELGHYFRNMYNIMKYIDNAGINDKKFYSNLFRAQLSSYELLLLFYNSISELGFEKFKPLIESYSLFKTMPSDKLIQEEHKNFYNTKAFNIDNNKIND